MFSPQFDFRFCEMRYEFSPFNSWNPLPVDPQSNSSLYQTNIQFQKLSDFILIADQIRALVSSRGLSSPRIICFIGTGTRMGNSKLVQTNGS